LIEISRLHFITLEMTAEFLYLEYRKEKIHKRRKSQETGWWVLNVEWLFMYNNFWTLNLELLNFQLSNFLLKTDFSIHQIFPLLSKIWYSKWPLWNFFECWMLNLKWLFIYNNFKPSTFKLSNLNCWLKFLGFISLRSKWQRRCLYLEYRKETINYYFKCWMIVHVQQLLNLEHSNFELSNFLLKNRLLDTSNFSIAFQNLILEVTIMELFWILDFEWLFMYNNFWTLNFQTF